MTEESHCGNPDVHISHRWTIDFAEMGAIRYYCPGTEERDGR